MSSSPSPSRPAASALPAEPLVLASASPRRRDILSDERIPFVVRPSNVDETPRPGERAVELVERLARAKAEDVARALADEPARAVLGADTIVVLDEEILGKPRDSDHAVEMLMRLTGRSHRVMTGIALAWSDGRATRSQVVTSEVEMRPASRQEIVDYVATGESLDKAGAYAIQGGAVQFVVGVVGSRTNVIGLPRDETRALLEREGALPARDRG